MPQGYRPVSRFEALATVGSTIIGVGVLALPRLATETAGTGAPLAVAMATVLACLGCGLLVVLHGRHPGLDAFALGPRLLGPYLGRAAAVVAAGFFVVLTALTAREFGEVVITALLPRTPLEVSTSVMLLLAAYSTRHDTLTVARLHGFYLPLIVGPGLAIILLALKDARYTYLLPLTGEEGLGALLRAALKVGILFHGFAVSTLVLPLLRPGRRPWVPLLGGVALAGALYVAVVAGTVAVFGKWETELLLWPTLDLARQTFIPGGVIERLDALFVAIWVTAVFTTLLSTYHLASVGLARALGLRDFRLLVAPQLPVLFAIALLPANIEELYVTILRVGAVGYAATYGYPLLLAVGSVWRARGGRAAPAADAPARREGAGGP